MSVLHNAIDPYMIMTDFDLNDLADQARSLYKAGSLEESRECYARLCELDPHDAQAWNMLGVISRRLGDLHAAENCHRRAVKCMPGAPDLHFALGMTLQARSKMDGAADSYRETLRLNPQHLAGAIALSRLLAASGQAREALRYSLLTLRQGTREPEVLRHFIRVLNMQQDVRALQEARAGLLLCFDAADLDLQQLSRPVTEILKREPLFVEMLSLVREGAIQELRAGILAGRFTGLLQDRLLIKALTWTLLCDPDFELLLGGLRLALLRICSDSEGAPPRQGIVDDDGTLLAAIACQCFSSEYCYSTAADESSRLEALEQDLAADIAAGRWDAWRDPARLCVYGMYRPLYRLPGADRLFSQADRLRDDAFREFVRIQWSGPQQELRIRAGIPGITAIENTTSRKVRDMYEESPYPPWSSVARHLPRPFVQVITQMFPAIEPPRTEAGTVKMLVAGCGTGKQAIMSASRFANSRVLAVDLSLSSLAYAQRKADELGIDNIEFAHADILQLAALPDRFHVIESVGVLHHMEDPQQGLAVLAGLLHCNGLMNIGLYSELARRHIAGLQDHFRRTGRVATADVIRQARQEILASGTEASRRVARLADFYSISGCRDLLFHVQERRYSLPEISAMLARSGLRFLGFGWTDQRVPGRYRQLNPDDPSMTDLDKWNAFEQQYPDTFLGMYVFWCQKI